MSFLVPITSTVSALTFAMLLSAALFSGLLFVPTVLTVPGASVAGHPFQLNHWHDAAESDWAGAYFTEASVRSIFHGLFRNHYRSHPHHVLYNRALSNASPQRSPSPPYRVRPGPLPSPRLVLMASLVKPILFYLPV